MCFMQLSGPYLRSEYGFEIFSPSLPSILPGVIDVGGPADPIAPAIIIPPKNTSVTMGRNEAIMECVANARYLFTTHKHTRTSKSARIHTDRLEQPIKTFHCCVWYSAPQMILQIFCLNMMERFVRLSFRTSSPFFPLIPRLRSAPRSQLQIWLLSLIQRLNQNDRCTPSLPRQCVTLKQNMNPH